MPADVQSSIAYVIPPTQVPINADPALQQVATGLYNFQQYMLDSVNLNNLLGFGTNPPVLQVVSGDNFISATTAGQKVTLTHVHSDVHGGAYDFNCLTTITKSGLVYTVSGTTYYTDSVGHRISINAGPAVAMTFFGLPPPPDGINNYFLACIAGNFQWLLAGSC